jgi:hypothetical protein
MKLMYRLMLSFFAIILTLMVIVSISFINVTNNTMYHNTWQQLKSYSDSLIQDSIRYNMATQSFEGFATESLNSNANLLHVKMFTLQSMIQLTGKSLPVMALLRV